MLHVEEIDPRRIVNHSNLFQSAYWAHLKENRGYDTQAFWVDYRGRRTLTVTDGSGRYRNGGTIRPSRPADPGDEYPLPSCR
jgi:hypothetical protein